MPLPEIEEVQLRWILLWYRISSDKGLKLKEATKNVNESYGKMLNISKYHGSSEAI